MMMLKQFGIIILAVQTVAVEQVVIQAPTDSII